MAVENPVDVWPVSSLTGRRVLHLSAYVDRAINDVLSEFTASGIDHLIAAAVRTALGDESGEQVRTHVSAPVWMSGIHVRVPVAWRASGPDGRASEGTATISLLVVQSGRDAITELLVAVPVSDAVAPSATLLLHRILDELSLRLESSGS